MKQPKRKGAAHYAAMAAQLLAEMNRLNERIDTTHAEGERLRAQTQIIKVHTEVTLSRLQEQINTLSGAASPFSSRPVRATE